jgi:hypothetical protein
VHLFRRIHQKLVQNAFFALQAKQNKMIIKTNCFKLSNLFFFASFAKQKGSFAKLAFCLAKEAKKSKFKSFK